jgi:hypothetical protein
MTWVKARAEYIKWVMEEYELSDPDHIFCLSRNCVGGVRVSPHHIFSRARYVGHPMLHDKRNLIMLCQTCHEAFERFERQEEYEQLVEERGLEELFNGEAATFTLKEKP